MNIVPIQTIHNHVSNEPTLVSVFATRFYAGVTAPPEGYRLADGPCLVYMVRSTTISETHQLYTCSVQFKAYHNTEVDVAGLLKICLSALMDRPGVNIKFILFEGGGEILREPQSDWPFTIFYLSFLLND